MSSERVTNSVDELLQLNSARNLDIIERNCKIGDLNIYCKVYKDKLNQLKNEVEKVETECKYLLELRDTKRQFYEEVKLREKRTCELLKTKSYNEELLKDILDLRKEKALELMKQNEILDKKRKEVYEQSKRIFERKPIIIKRNKLRNQVNKQKFHCAYMKQKLSNLEKVYAALQKTEKQIEQKKIIKFADAMVKYYKKQKVQEQINKTNKSQEQNLRANFQKAAEQPKKLETVSFSKPTEYDYFFKKQLATDIGSKYNLSTTDKCHNIETPMINMKPLQLLSLNLNYQFDPTKYSNINSYQSSKPSEHKYNEPPKNILSNIMKMSKTNFKSTIPKFEYSFQKFTSNQDRMSTTQNKQSQEKTVTQFEKQELKRQSDSQESTSKPKIAKTSEKNKKTDINTRAEKDERIFLSQPESRNSSQQENNFISLSQDSQKSAKLNPSQKQQKTAIKATKIDNVVHQKPSQTIKQNQMFNIQANETKKAENVCLKQNKPEIFNFQTGPPKQNPLECNIQNPQMLSIPKKCVPNENPPELNRQTSLNPMFNLPTTTPIVAKNVQLMSPKPGDTKSPYFNPTQEDQRLHSSAEESDKIVNVSSGPSHSQISAEFISEEYIEGTADQPTNIEQMLNQGAPIGFNNEGYNVMEYYEDNPEIAAMMQEQYISPPNLPGFMSPRSDQNVEQNQKNNCPTPTSTSNNIFGAGQGSGNSFFSFGQPNPKPGNIFNMF